MFKELGPPSERFATEPTADSGEKDIQLGTAALLDGDVASAVSSFINASFSFAAEALSAAAAALSAAAASLSLVAAATTAAMSTSTPGEKTEFRGLLLELLRDREKRSFVTDKR